MSVETYPEQEAERVLAQAKGEFTAVEEPWNAYVIDVELVGSLLFGLGVQRVPDLSIGERSYAGFLDASSRLIAVEESHHAHRQRFSIAHEIGHFVLHFLPTPSGQELFACTDGDMEIGGAAGHHPTEAGLHQKQEAEANLFAGALLMPGPSVRAMFRVTGGRLLGLARHFDVSPKAMEIRLEQLHLSAR